MARHGLRSLTIWLFALPLVLAGSMPVPTIVLWQASTSYIFLGLDDQKGGTLLAPELKKHVAEELARESAILKEQRKAREAKTAAGKDGKK